jgi:prevent-host-death family protein
MAFVGIRTLSRETSRVIQEFEETGEPVILTREGKPIGALVPVDERQVEEMVLATAPEFQAAPEGEPGSEIVSLGEVAAERGLALDEDQQALAAPVDEELHELATEAAEFEVKSVVDLLSEPLAEEVLTAARAEIGTLNGEIMATFKEGEFDPDEKRELTEATAALYGRMLPRHLFPALGQVGALGQAPNPGAYYKVSYEANRSTGDLVRKINRSMRIEGQDSVPAYAAAVRAFAVIWDAKDAKEDDEDEKWQAPDSIEWMP